MPNTVFYWRKLDCVGMDCFVYSNEDPLIILPGRPPKQVWKGKPVANFMLFRRGNFDRDREEM
jgi:hypothetical protein